MAWRYYYVCVVDSFSGARGKSMRDDVCFGTGAFTNGGHLRDISVFAVQGQKQKVDFLYSVCGSYINCSREAFCLPYFTKSLLCLTKIQERYGRFLSVDRKNLFLN